jgi:hypothetical protein
MSKEWKDKVEELNRLHQELQQKPETEKRGYSFSVGGVLNAYREGDLSFEEAKAVFQRLPVVLSVDNFNSLQALVEAFHVADDSKVTSARLRVVPFGEISWTFGGDVRIELEIAEQKGDPVIRDKS